MPRSPLPCTFCTGPRDPSMRAWNGSRSVPACKRCAHTPSLRGVSEGFAAFNKIQLLAKQHGRTTA